MDTHHSLSVGVFYYISPRRFCSIRLTQVMPAQHEAPIIMGLPPVFISLTILLFRPIAAIARVIMNLLSSLSGSNAEDGTPLFIHIVVTNAAPIKKSIK